MQRSAQRSLMAEVPDEIFIEGVRRAVAANKDFIPPYGEAAAPAISQTQTVRVKGRRKGSRDSTEASSAPSWPSYASPMCYQSLRACHRFAAGAGGSLYVRPLLVGSGARIGLQPSDEYTFIVLVVPVGAYYKGSGPTPVSAVVIDDYDRAAPKGVGSVKVAGNYVADLLPSVLGKKRGFPIGLYLDAETRRAWLAG
jgi:branched-subunit amino acid aminotransferase/4-amino-4-deoxychorismate lyase